MSTSEMHSQLAVWAGINAIRSRETRYPLEAAALRRRRCFVRTRQLSAAYEAARVARRPKRCSDLAARMVRLDLELHRAENVLREGGVL